MGLLCVCSGPKCDVEAKLCSTLKPCLHGGVCTDIDSSSYRCDCPLGHSGPTCNDSAYIFFIHNNVCFSYFYRKTVFFSFAEVTLDITANFSGKSYLQLDNELLDRYKKEHSISMTFTTDSANGLLYWQGQEPNNDGVVDNYISISSEPIIDKLIKFVII